MELPVHTKVELQFTCQECGQPVFAYGPFFSRLVCSYCDSEVKINIEMVWKNFLHYPMEEKLEYLGGHIIFYGGVRRPCCIECHKKLKVNDIETGTDGVVLCQECGTPNHTFPVPEWMKNRQGDFKERQLKPVQIFCAEKEDLNAGAGKEASHVLFSCLHCGSPLKIKAETPHILTCEYCGSEQYMPDTLWRRFHAIPKKRAWYIRWE